MPTSRMVRATCPPASVFPPSVCFGVGHATDRQPTRGGFWHLSVCALCMMPAGAFHPRSPLLHCLVLSADCCNARLAAPRGLRRGPGARADAGYCVVGNREPRRAPAREAVRAWGQCRHAAAHRIAEGGGQGDHRRRQRDGGLRHRAAVRARRGEPGRALHSGGGLPGIPGLGRGERPERAPDDGPGGAAHAAHERGSGDGVNGPRGQGGQAGGGALRVFDGDEIGRLS
jgi:hypothetical protein